MKIDKSERICAFCEAATPLYDDDLMLCNDKGIVDCRYSCRKFSYDPLKRKVRLKNAAPALEYVDIESV